MKWTVKNVKEYLRENGTSGLPLGDLQNMYITLAKAANSRIKRIKSDNLTSNPIFSNLPEHIRDMGFSTKKLGINQIYSNLSAVINFMDNPLSTVGGYKKSISTFGKALAEGKVRGSSKQFITYYDEKHNRLATSHINEFIKPIKDEETIKELYKGLDRFLKNDEYKGALGMFGSERLVNELHDIRIEHENEVITDSYGNPLEPFTADWFMEMLAKELGLHDRRQRYDSAEDADRGEDFEVLS